MNKRKRVAAHKHRAHMRKIKEKRKLALGVVSPSIGVAKRRPISPAKKGVEVTPAKTKEKVAAVAAAVRPEPQVPVGKAVPAKGPKAPRGHRVPRKTAGASDIKTAAIAEATAKAPKKAQPSKVKAKPEKSVKSAETPVSPKARKSRKPRTEPAA